MQDQQNDHQNQRNQQQENLHDVLTDAIENLTAEVCDDIFAHARQRNGHKVAENSMVDQLYFCIKYIGNDQNHGENTPGNFGQKRAQEGHDTSAEQSEQDRVYDALVHFTEHANMEAQLYIDADKAQQKQTAAPVAPHGAPEHRPLHGRHIQMTEVILLMR